MSRIARIYFIAQAIGVACWWFALFRWPTLRSNFFPRSLTWGDLTAFLVADGTVIVIGSTLVALFSGARPALARNIAFIVGGALLYACALTVVWTVHAPTAAPGVLLMLPATLATLYFALGWTRTP